MIKMHFKICLTVALVFRIQRHPKDRPGHWQGHHQVLGYICLKPYQMAVKLIGMTSSIICIYFKIISKTFLENCAFESPFLSYYEYDYSMFHLCDLENHKFRRSFPQLVARLFPSDRTFLASSANQILQWLKTYYFSTFFNRQVQYLRSHSLSYELQLNKPNQVVSTSLS